MASKCSRLDIHKLQHPHDEHVLTDDRYNQFVTSISSGMTLKSFARAQLLTLYVCHFKRTPIAAVCFNCLSLTMPASITDNQCLCLSRLSRW